MTQYYEHLGIFGDLVEEARCQGPLVSPRRARPGDANAGARVLGFCRRPEMPLDVRLEQRWERDGLAGEELSWSVGYGPRTHAWLLKPAHAHGHRRIQRSGGPA